jgi:hypothetical protein
VSKRKIAAAVLVLVLLIVGAVWAWSRDRANAQAERVRQLQDKLFANGPPKREQAEEFGKEIAQLNPDQRAKVFEHMRETMQRRMQKQIDEYFALPPEKRNDYMDTQIQAMEKMRKEFEKRRQQDGIAGAPGGPLPAPGVSGQGRPPGAVFFGPGGPNASPEARSQFRNQMLDHTSPELRAKIAAYMSDMQIRRLALGLPTGGPGMMMGEPPP